MEKTAALEELRSAIVNCVKLEEVKALAKRALEIGAQPLEIVDTVKGALDEVGDLYEKREYFLMELTLAGSTASEIMNMIKPELKASVGLIKGKVVIGTVAGDLHYIGKDIVVVMLESQGLEVVDLGVDVPCNRFIEAVKTEKPDILAMSGLLTVVVDEMGKVIEALRNEGLRDKVKVMIGGRAVNPEYAREIGADAFGASAFDAAKLAVEWTGEKMGGQ